MVAGGKKSKAKSSISGIIVTPTESQEDPSPSYHGRTFTKSRIAPMQPSNQRVTKRYEKARREQEAR